MQMNYVGNNLFFFFVGNNLFNLVQLEKGEIEGII